MEIEYPRVRLVWRGKPEVSSEDKAMVGRRIKLYWPGEDAWFSGEVVDVFDIGSVTIAKVLYDDGEEKSHHLGIWEHHWLTDEWGNAEVQTTAKPGTVSAREGLAPFKYSQQEHPPADASLIDEKLWDGAAALGWSLKAKGGGHYIYFAPDGVKYTSRRTALDAAGLEEVDADQEPKPAGKSAGKPAEEVAKGAAAEAARKAAKKAKAEAAEAARAERAAALAAELNSIDKVLDSRGGYASDGVGDVLDMDIRDIHARTSYFCGSVDDVKDLEACGDVQQGAATYDA